MSALDSGSDFDFGDFSDDVSSSGGDFAGGALGVGDVGSAVANNGTAGIAQYGVDYGQDDIAYQAAINSGLTPNQADAAAQRAALNTPGAVAFPGAGTGQALSAAQVAAQYQAQAPVNQPVNNFAGGLLGAAGQILGGALIPVTGQAQAAAAAAAAQAAAARNKQIAQYALIGGVALIVLLIAMRK